MVAVLLAATIVTLRLKHQDADGPSVLFPGGAPISGMLYAGPEPDWRFADDRFTIEEPQSSRRQSVDVRGPDVELREGRSFGAATGTWESTHRADRRARGDHRGARADA